jgi:5-methylcytosine-specific restriction protein A
VARSVQQWCGKDDDEASPARVRLRVFERKQGRCHRCTRKITAGERWTCEHLVALVNGGKNAESNLGLTCKNCLNGKNADDLAEKAMIYRKRSKHLGLHKAKRPFTKRADPWNKEYLARKPA